MTRKPFSSLIPRPFPFLCALSTHETQVLEKAGKAWDDVSPYCVRGFTETCRLNLIANAVHGSARVHRTAIQHLCMSAGHRHGRAPHPCDVMMSTSRLLHMTNGPRPFPFQIFSRTRVSRAPSAHKKGKGVGMRLAVQHDHCVGE